MGVRSRAVGSRPVEVTLVASRRGVDLDLTHEPILDSYLSGPGPIRCSDSPRPGTDLRTVKNTKR